MDIKRFPILDEVENKYNDLRIDLDDVSEAFRVLLEMFDKHVKKSNQTIMIYYCESPKCKGYVYSPNEIGHPNECFVESDPMANKRERDKHLG